MKKLLILLLLGVFATGFNSAIYADDNVKTEKQQGSDKEIDEEPDCE